MSLLDDFMRVARSRPCPVCQHGNWCLVSRDTPPSKVICQRVESGRRWGDAGWLHRLRDDGWRPMRTVRIMRTIAPPPCSNSFDELARRYRTAVPPSLLGEFAAGLGVSADSLDRLGIGWTGRAWAFPMINPRHSDRVCGIRLRAPRGAKFSVKGGKEGVFVPVGLAGTGPLLLLEGPTDTAAALDLGFDAVGRPSCSGGARLIIAVIKKIKPTSVVVVADADGPGQRGAAALARAVLVHHRDVRIVTPPVKDLREWLCRGATPQVVLDAIAGVLPLQLKVTSRRVPR